jgi:hypothetical protein
MFEAFTLLFHHIPVWPHLSPSNVTNLTFQLSTMLYQVKQTLGVWHCGLVIYIKNYLKANEELWRLKYFTVQKYNLQNNPLKENQNPSRYYLTLELISSFNTSQDIIFQKSSCTKIDLLSRGQNPLSHYPL